MNENYDSLVDLTIRCECGELFVWTMGEQIFLTELVEEGKMKEVISPKRCPECRAKKKARFAERDKEKKTNN